MEQPLAAAWKYVAGLTCPEDLPVAAAQLLAADYDSPSLRDLAGRSRRDDTSEIDALFHRAMAELRIPISDDEIAERCIPASGHPGQRTPRGVVWRSRQPPSEALPGRRSPSSERGTAALGKRTSDGRPAMCHDDAHCPVGCRASRCWSAPERRRFRRRGRSGAEEAEGLRRRRTLPRRLVDQARRIVKNDGTQC